MKATAPVTQTRRNDGLMADGPWGKRVQCMTKTRSYPTELAERVVADHAAEWTAARSRRAAALVAARATVGGWATTWEWERKQFNNVVRSVADLTTRGYCLPKPTRANLWRAAIESRQAAAVCWGSMRGNLDDGYACCGYDDGRAMMAEAYLAEAHGLMRAALRMMRLEWPVLEPHTLIGCGCPACRVKRRNR